MATNLRLLVLMALLSLVSSADIPPETRNQDLVIATSEMQRANYFTFVLLLNMAKLDPRLQGNITFLMPNDRMLSKITLQQHTIPDFLLRHSIPSTMLFDYLHHIPTGSTIPSSHPDYMLKISNHGRWSFFLNNAKLISPNICTTSSSVRCHGIDGVLSLAVPASNLTDDASPSAICFSSSNSSPSATPPPPPPFPLASGASHGLNMTPAAAAAAGPSVSPPKSGSSVISTFSVTCMVLSLWVSFLSIVP
ncbi:FAS1 domain-containing protein SELMODRAFT_448915 [Humulus lupulus]|uniref:FAS1 domain-containing protein SELMODRAFT_448915 n=1 Tax=Humulus lupulus TaxID=3486 RepID=UPI002B40EDBC|nr:FAS1 domain-containing protein SELMODRAFT_448915 [Humulus lupulus]